MIIHDMSQRSDEWFAVRLGKITGTSFPTMANGKKDSIDTLCLKTAAEIITGLSSEEKYANSAMEWGVELEPLAKRAYEMDRLLHVADVGFVELDEYIGISPDGLVGEDGGVEIKCPMPHTHLKYLSAKGQAWKAYKWQVQGALWVTGRKWWDFVSFCPAFPPDMQLLIEHVMPDDDCLIKLDSGAWHCRKRIAEILNGVRDGAKG